MTDRDLQGGVPAEVTQDRVLRSFQAPVPVEVYEVVAQSFRRAGFKSTADGIRAVCVAFERHRDVRKAVMLHAPGILGEFAVEKAS